jgi:hypothetical protein
MTAWDMLTGTTRFQRHCQLSIAQGIISSAKSAPLLIERGLLNEEEVRQVVNIIAHTRK